MSVDDRIEVDDDVPEEPLLHIIVSGSGVLRVLTSVPGGSEASLGFTLLRRLLPLIETFHNGVRDSEPKMTLTQMVRWADDTSALRKNLAEGLDQIRKVKRAAKRMARNARGQKKRGAK